MIALHTGDEGVRLADFIRSDRSSILSASRERIGTLPSVAGLHGDARKPEASVDRQRRAKLAIVPLVGSWELDPLTELSSRRTTARASCSASSTPGTHLGKTFRNVTGILAGHPTQLALAPDNRKTPKERFEISAER